MNPTLEKFHPKDPGYLTWVIVPKDPSGGIPKLVKAFPTDPDPIGRQREGVPVSMGAMWDSQEDAENALAMLVSADIRETFHVRPILVHFFVGDTRGQGA